MQSISNLECERTGLEADLQFIVNNIPHSNQSGFRVYADDRTTALAASGCPVGDPELLESVLRKEYSALPEAQRREHEREGKLAYQEVMQKARNILQQRGKRYLELCDRLSALAHPMLLPLIRLLLVPEASVEEAPLHGKGLQNKYGAKPSVPGGIKRELQVRFAFFCSP